MSEFNIHNIRFYEFFPEAIHCLAYSNELKFLALSRADGSIELWNCHFKPFKQQTIVGQKGSSVESLVWCGDRLFSSGLNGFILEYDSTTYLVKNQVSVTGGPTWCLALSPNKELLAAGTEGGHVSLFSITEEGLVSNKVLKKQKSRILSIGWSEDNEYLVTGSVDFVHLISITTEKTLQFSVTKVDPAKETIIWCVALLPDKTIVTGDSRGMTCFWDGKFGTLINSVQTHQAAVLTMQVSADSKSVYVAGVDPVIVEVCLVDSGGKQGKRKMWVKSIHRRIHSHDVRSLALTQEGKLFSGGVDTYLALSFYPPRTAIKYPATPPRGYISIAQKANSVLLAHKDKVELWKLGRSYSGGRESRFLPVDEDKVKVAEIKLTKHDRVEFCAVSPLAQRIAVISKGRLKVYKLSSQQNEEQKIEKLNIRHEDILLSSQIAWINETKLVSATHSAVLQVLNIKNNEVVVSRTFCLPSNSIARQIILSHGGDRLGILDATDQITVFSMKDSHSFVLPRSKYPVTSVAFTSNEELILAYSNNNVTEYSLKNSLCTPFGKEIFNNPYTEILKSNNIIQNISVCDSHIFLHSISSFHVINRDAATVAPSPRSRKTMKLDPVVDSESNDSTSLVKFSSNGKLSTVARSNHIFYFSHINNEQLLSVEINPLWLLDSLPPALKVKKFGAS